MLKALNSQKKAFAKWREYSKTCDEITRLHLLNLKFARQKYVTVLFMGWRSAVMDKKEKRIARLNLLWKSLREGIKEEQMIKVQTLAVLRARKDLRINIKKACFDALRVARREEKLVFVETELYEVEKPKIEEAKKEIHLKENEGNESGKSIGVNAIKK